MGLIVHKQAESRKTEAGNGISIAIRNGGMQQDEARVNANDVRRRGSCGLLSDECQGASPERTHDNKNHENWLQPDPSVS